MRSDYYSDLNQAPEVIRRGTRLLAALRKHSDTSTWSRRRLRWFAAAHSFMGTAHSDIKEFAKARSHHETDYKIGEGIGDDKIQSRALEQLARVYIKEGNQMKALENLAKRAQLPRDSEESARLFHKMANCYLKVNKRPFSLLLYASYVCSSVCLCNLLFFFCLYVCLSAHLPVYV
ncbi:tetratricopeptide repeat protein 25 [Aplysia californica]|uniref:Tetratricopeptide repeat protein 25 n=1 Tax=Aplysia californica TaxID=6500 RepID=A0ABM1A8F5_APLCA|nr:tetratricopeptide repeat protein 25 [Aplysia californica]